MDSAKWKSVLRKAVEIEGSQSKLADKLETTQQGISKSLRLGQKLPPTWVRPLSDITGVPPHELRPDIFEPAE